MMNTEVYQESRSAKKQSLIWQLNPAGENEDGWQLVALLADLETDRP